MADVNDLVKTTGTAGPEAAARLLALISEMLREMHVREVAAPTLDDDLERTLGFDSLARMELMLRIEAAFGVRMPDLEIEDARTAGDVLKALRQAVPRSGTPAPHVAEAPPRPAATGMALPRHAATLTDALRWHAEQAPERIHLTVLDGEVAIGHHTHASLMQGARAVAAALQQRHGVAANEAVAIMLPTGLAFFEVFAGILLAGGVPVPVYPPLRASQIEDHLRRQAHILDNAQAVLLVCDAQALPAARILRAGCPTLRGTLAPEALRAGDRGFVDVPRRADDIALLQYTSGSTGQPKGVVLTHANLLTNVRAMGQALQVDGARDVFVSWLPLYHDMGLIGAWWGSLVHGVPLVIMPPQSFLARPARWLRAIQRHGGTISAAPNFAYDILAGKVPEDALRDLDLSRWRVAANGAEPVRASTLQRFAERFRRYGFDARAMMPMYGLAECGLGLTFPPLGRGPRIECIDRARLHRDGVAEPLDAPDASRGTRVVGCGQPLPGHEVRAVDAHGRELPERHEGRIEFRGPSATAGYFRNPEATRALFRGDWLDTGDVGYIAEGELHLTSRAKDLIKRGGHNIHPYDLEEAVDHLPEVRRGCVAVFGAADRDGTGERIVVVAELRPDARPRRAEVRRRIAETALAVLGVPADDIVLAEPRTLLKTSSGKLRRAGCRALYEQGRLSAGPRPVAWQLARLWLGALVRRAGETLRRAAGGWEAAWMWTAFGLGAAASVPAAVLPSRALRKRAARAIARTVIGATRLPVHVIHDGDMPGPPVVVAANHASYVDWLLLTAVLPADAAFVAKRELAASRPLRWVLERMGTRFVEREDVHRSVEDAKALLGAVRAGALLVFFPEGTLTRAPGVRPFYMGAFLTAAHAGASVVPVSLRGTRSVLRDGSWRPRRHPVQVHVHAALQPSGAAWADALALRDATRERIASDCGEPLLAPFARLE